ncbi:helix-turn-helix transcriptional regulator [Corynebacterium aquilae]|uniref:ArsR family transcriptional regulator n=1 Tax=Corynebacterium aquilae DSM 44791 TaxID=1431546 RepID=A0A1L7CG34_9CORY|nr:metalloregulator ArsR/SmtB family transcription factor [Corynebacterium aquilae]APT84799.1 ArsR family transcriptional regulator [Corynebacterium aquilae DSM 44791]
MSTQGANRTVEGDTRQAILRTLLTSGPLTTADISSRLGLAAAGVRRHLDNLTWEELVETCPARQPNKGRGRPAKAFRLTVKGRDRFGHDYDSLASLAVETLRETGGEKAVKEFARKRVKKILQEVNEAVDTESLTPEEKAQRIADVLSRHGYAAEVRATDRGVQLCQHHCPISEVASAHPELCEAEHEALAELFGQHIQPLASIADGHDICTTHIPAKVNGNLIPLTPITHTP